MRIARTSLPPVVLAAIVVILGWAYTHRLATNPLKWEEPRRCLVAMEMMYSGNYVTPRILGEAYLKKPPLQNWLVVVASGFDPARVGPLAVRSISILALAGCCLILWCLGTDGIDPRRDALPAVVFATTGTVLQHGRAGEIDMLFCFLVLAAVAFFEVGRRRGERWVQWFFSQVVLAAGVLAKWIAPLFFFPPVLWLAWRHRAVYRPSVLAGLLGLLALATIVGAWFVPFSLMSPGSGVEQRWWSEIAARTMGHGLSSVIPHLSTYPVLVLSALLPWSLWLPFMWGGAIWRRSLDLIRRDPWLKLSAAIVVWALVVFLAIPEQKARYLLPAFPFAAVLFARLVGERTSWFSGRRTAIQRLWRLPLTWAVAVAGWTLLAWRVGGRQLATQSLAWVPALGGAVVLVAAGAWLASRQRSLPAAPLLVVGLLYAVVHAGLIEVREAERNGHWSETAAAFAGVIDDERPVVVHRDMSLKLCQPLTRRLGRPLGRMARPAASAWWIAPEGMPGPDPPFAPRATAVARSPGAGPVSPALWEVPAPEAWSAMAGPLFALPLPEEVRAEREAALALARAAHAAEPANADATVWWGRRTAYLGRYREAIEIYTRGLRLHPDDARLLRHRGHRFITVRDFASAIADLRAAARLVRGQPDEIEPDGLPNPSGIPTSTLQTNIWYHLGLAHYVRGELADAEDCYRRCLALSTNDDMRVAASHWLYATLRRRGDDAAARAVLDPIRAQMEIHENHTYHELLLMYRGERNADAVLAAAEEAGSGAFASAAYGVANWYLVSGRREEAAELLLEILERGEWPAFGHLAAEADVARIWDRAL